MLRTSDDRTIRAGELVVCARQWARDGLAVLRERLNITVTREGVVYLEPVAPESFEIGG